MLDVEERDQIAVVRLRHGRVNALDLELSRALDNVLRSMPANGIRGVVLTSALPVFCAGVDIVRLAAEPASYADEFLRVSSAALRTLFTLPVPTVAAINGAAIAGGCILACACDHRIVANSAPVGITELAIGIAIPSISLAIATHALGPGADEKLFEGRVYLAAEALAAGIASRVVAPGDEVPTAFEHALGRARIPSEVYRITKLQLLQPALALATSTACLDDTVLANWTEPDTVRRLQQHLSRGRDDPSP